MAVERLPSDAPVPSGRLVIRRWIDDDEPALSRAIAESAEHLRPWMIWIAEEPLSRVARLDLIARWEQAWRAGEDATYGIFLAADAEHPEPRVAGGCGLHRRTAGRPDILEIGYWVHAHHVGRGIATEAARALTTAAFSVAGATEVQIKHEPSNVASGAVPKRLGYAHVGDVTEGTTVDGSPRALSIWAITRDEWAAAAR